MSARLREWLSELVRKCVIGCGRIPEVVKRSDSRVGAGKIKVVLNGNGIINVVQRSFVPPHAIGPSRLVGGK